jgi:5-methylcytosine-specific restriction protein A
LTKDVQRMKLARDPLCEDCLGHDVTRAAQQVHHLVPVVERPDLAFVMDNLRSLCTTCHARREAEEVTRRTPLRR